jgi:flagellar biosynthesis component FlhA
MCMGAASITNFNILIETCPHDNRVAHITAGNLVLSPITLLAPIIGGLVARSFSLDLLFQLSIGFSVAALLWVLMWMKEPRTIDLYPASEARA